MEQETLNFDGDLLQITPLGAGQEVGRSCVLVEFRGRRIMLDCGIHPGLNGINSLPYLDQSDPGDIDILFITHFHLDHCGALPWLLKTSSFKGKIFMTHATKAIYKWLLTDYTRIMALSMNELLYTEADLLASLDRIETVHFHREYEYADISFSCYHAGHVLGAAMFYINVAGVKILYTGDYSCQEDRHLHSAEIPCVNPDILIMESTYGIHVHEDREKREYRFTSFIRNIVLGGGKCLIPIFALGRAQELLLILEEYWRTHDEVKHIPIFYASNLARKCMNVYQTYIGSMNDSFRDKVAISDNPFNFRYVNYLKSLEEFDDTQPCVALASPGMLQNGISRTLFELWCIDPKNGVMLAGYAVEGTLAKELASEPEKICSLTGKFLPRKCSINSVSFSAHADYSQALEFVHSVKPKIIVLVHGERREMGRMKNALVRDCESINVGEENIFTPSNCFTIQLRFKGDRQAKVIAKLSEQLIETGKLSGVILKRGFGYHIMDPADIKKYTFLNTTSINQCLLVPFSSNRETLLQNLSVLTNSDFATTKEWEPLALFDDLITLEFEQEAVSIKWTSDRLTDSLVEAVIAVVLETDKIKEVASIKKNEETTAKRILRILEGFYNHSRLVVDKNNEKIHLYDVACNSVIVEIDCETMEVLSTDEERKKVEKILKYFKGCVKPFCCSH